MSFGYYSPFTIQTGQVPSTQTNFPVLLLPTDSRFKTVGNGGHVASSSGYDLRPYSDAALTTPLTFELVPGTYSPTTGFFEMWVLVPSLADGYVIYLGYGDSGITTDGSSPSTWVSAYKGVWHLANGSSLNCNDSTSNANNGTATGGITAVSGKIDGGAFFPDVSGTERIDVGNASSVNITAAITLEGWINWNGASGVTHGANNDSMISKNEGGGYGIIANLVGPRLETWFYINGGYANAGENLSDFSANTWYYIAATFDGTDTKFYRDGVLKETVNRAGSISTISLNLLIGCNPDAGPSYSGPWAGTLDEIRVRNAAITQDEITTNYNNQLAPGTFTALGAEVQAATGVGARFIRSNGGIWVFNTGGAAGGGLIGGSGGGF